eukprot:TRINITY_DN102760_c0_g1_i1.p1 TRINITY_DN102760_c0_g1~~TRINITY_DN102760_c0_g1_i1.p1  ORF type:complete len:850 (-),score=103.22 TRINITY_DN102760_c0_g1_i1:94-2643(-)
MSYLVKLPLCAGLLYELHPLLLVVLVTDAALQQTNAVATSAACGETAGVCTARLAAEAACSSEALLRSDAARTLLGCIEKPFAECRSLCLDDLGKLGLPVNRSSPMCTIRDQLMAQYSGRPEFVVSFAKVPPEGQERPIILPASLAGTSPMPFLSYPGDYQRCRMEDGLQYCLAQGSTMVKSEAMGELTFVVSLGVCRPSECTGFDIAGGLQPITKLMGLEDLDVSCRAPGKSGVQPQWTQGQILAFVLCSTLLVFAISGSVVASWGSCSARFPQLGTQSRVRAVAAAIMEAWSLPRNLASFIRLRESKHDSRRASLDALDGLRVLSMLWVLLGHTVLWPTLSIQYENIAVLLPPKGKMTELLFQLVPGGFFAVDTFFWLSGFLSTRALQSKVLSSPRLLTARGFCLRLYPMAILSRWLRLSAIYGFILIFSQTWYRELGTGSLLWNAKYPSFGTRGVGGCANSIDSDDCKNNWWANLLYINNVAPGAGGSKCLAHTWYLACDMQLFLVVPILVLVRERFGSSTGWVCLVSLTTVSVALNAWATWHKNEVSDPLFGNFGTGRFMQDVYEVSWMRAQPYLLGTGTSWILNAIEPLRQAISPMPCQPSQSRDHTDPECCASCSIAPETLEESERRDDPTTAAGEMETGPMRREALQPAVHDPLLPSACASPSHAATIQAAGMPFDRQPGFACALQLLSFLAMGFVVFVPVTRYRCKDLADCLSVETAPWSKAANIIYPSLSHLVWGLGLSALMLLSMLRAPGTGWLSRLLGLELWQPLAKLTYGAYLVHPLVLVFFYCTRDSYIRYQEPTLVLNFLGFAMLSFFASWLLWLTVEKPCANLVARIPGLGRNR